MTTSKLGVVGECVGGGESTLSRHVSRDRVLTINKLGIVSRCLSLGERQGRGENPPSLLNLNGNSSLSNARV